jgi:hypothetical protein
MAAKLKVFVSSDGLTDYVVAASSRPKALAAWGAHQDLFKTGGARQTDDPELVKAALAQPGEVLRRAAGGDKAAAILKVPKRPAKPKGPSAAALKAAARAQARLDDVEAAHHAAVDRLAHDREALEAREARIERAYDEAREAAQAALDAAREALED